MKKMIKIFCFLFIFFISNFAFADMGGPVIKSYEAIVTNVNGTKPCDDHNHWMEERGILEYGTKIIVAEMDFDDKGIHTRDNAPMSQDGWSDVVVDNGKEKFWCRVYLNDLTALTKISETEVDFTRTIKGRILNEDGIKIYDGMSKYAYSVVGEIPYWAELTMYVPYDNAECPWYYTTYNGVSGWVCELDGDIGYKPYIEEIITCYEVEIRNNVDEKIGVIPANTKLTVQFDTDPWSRDYYIKYNGMSGYISSYDCVFLYHGKYKIKDNIEGNVALLYYSYSIDENSKVIGEIKSGTILSKVYGDNYDNYAFVEYEDKAGWISPLDYEWIKDEESSDVTEDSEINQENEKVYDVEENNNEIKQDIEANQDIKDVYAEDSDEEKVEVKQSINSMQMITLCIAGAVVITLTSFVTILLINKKKK